MTFVLVLIYGAASVGAGVLLLRALAGRSWDALIRSDAPVLATALLTGQALVAALWIGVGLAGWFTPRVVWACVALLIGLASPLLLPVARRSVGVARGVLSEVGAMPWWLRVVALLLAVLVVGFGVAAWLKAPVGDGEAFYMAYAKVIADAHRVAPMPGLYAPFSTIGLVAELHFAALMQVGDAGAAKLFVWLLALAAGAILAAICRRAGVGPQGRLVALVMLFTTTAFSNHISDGKVDLVAAALGLCAVYWAMVADVTARRLAIPLSGLCTGFAVVAKFSYVPAFVPAIVLLVAWQRLAGASGETPVRTGFLATASALMVFGAWAVLAVLPHLTKNAVLFGAPLAPFVGGPQDKNWLQQVWFPAEVTARILRTYPLALTFGRYPMQGGNVSFLLLAFAPLVWWLPRPQRFWDSLLFRLCLAGAVGTACWLVLRPSVIAPRYLLATLLLFVPLTARAAEHAITREVAPSWLSVGITTSLAAAVTIFAYPLLPLPKALLQYAQGRLPVCALASVHCNPLQRLNSMAAPGDRVFMLNYYGYWLRPDLLQCRDSYGDDRILVKLDGPGLTWEILRAGGFRYVVADKVDYADDLHRLSALRVPTGVTVTQILDTPQLELFEVTSASDTAKAAACQKVKPPAWSVIYPG